MDSEGIAALSRACTELGSCLLRQGLTVAVAESCTGGLLAAALTAVPGSSRWFEYGFVTYGARAKELILHVPSEYLNDAWIVSEPTAIAMARGAQVVSDADLSVGITGIAGPGGGTPERPVGTVAVAWVNRSSADAQTYHFSGDREAVRREAVLSAVLGLRMRLDRGFLARP